MVKHNTPTECVPEGDRITVCICSLYGSYYFIFELLKRNQIHYLR